MKIPQYQVALSFAGEQRRYVEEVARQLQAMSISVFYDGFEPSMLWGKNGVEAFQAIFERQSAYVVMFVSDAYVRKPWTRLERQAALSRMIKEDRDFVLPVRFDDTTVPGLPESTIYEDATRCTPAQLAVKIAEKLGVRPYTGKASDVPPPRMVSLIGEVAFDYNSYNGAYVIGYDGLTFETRWSAGSDSCIYVYDEASSIQGVALCRGAESISQVQNAQVLDYSSRYRLSLLGEVIVYRNMHDFYAALHITSLSDTRAGSNRDEVRFRYAIQANGSDDFSDFIDI